MLPSFAEMLRHLVGTQSTSSLNPELDRTNRGVLDHLANWLEDLNFQVAVHPVPDSNGKFNLIARKGSGTGGLLLSGHTDTVTADEDLWTSDPFEATESDERIYGLGSCDMKGFFPVALKAAASFGERDLRSPLTVLATADEEITMAGARHLSEKTQLDAEVAVIGEPTSMQPIYAHKGIFVLNIQVEGSSGHSSNPALGVNALDTMHEVLGSLIRYREELKAEKRHEGFDVSFPTLNLGCLHAGDSANRICGDADLLIDVRLLPGMSSECVLNEIERRIEHIQEIRKVPISIGQGFPPVEPYETSRDSDFLKTMEQYSGHQARTVAFGTEAPFLQRMGIETVVFGPGSIDQAHQADEYLAKDQIAPTQRVLERLIDKYCCQT